MPQMLAPGQEALMYEAISLERVRQVSVFLVVMAILLFIFGWFAWFIGVVAAVVVGLPAVVAFNRCESVQLLATGVHPCGSMLCVCCAGPRGELYGVQMTMLVGTILTLATIIVSIWTAVIRESDWLQTMRVICAVISGILLLTELLFLAAFRHAILIHEAYSVMMYGDGGEPRRVAVIASPGANTGPMVGGHGNFPLYEEEDYRRGGPIDPSGPPTGYRAQPDRLAGVRRRSASVGRSEPATDPFRSPQPRAPDSGLYGNGGDSGGTVRPSRLYETHGRFTTRSVSQADLPPPQDPQPNRGSMYAERNSARVRRSDPFI